MSCGVMAVTPHRILVNGSSDAPQDAMVFFVDPRVIHPKKYKSAVIFDAFLVQNAVQLLFPSVPERLARHGSGCMD